MAPLQRNSGKVEYFKSDEIPRMNPAWLTHEVLLSLREKGVDTNRLLPAGWVLPSRDTEQVLLSFRDTAAVFERAALLNQDPMFGFHMGQRRDFRAMGLVAYAAQTTATLHSFFQTVALHLPLYTEAVEVTLSAPGVMRWRILEPKGLRHNQYFEFLLTLFMKAARNCLEGSRVLVPQSVVLPFSLSTSEQERSAFWGGDVSETAEPVAEVSFRPSDLQRPLRSADPYLSRLIAEFALAKHAELITQADYLPRRVERLIYHNLDRADLSQAFVAAQLDMSSRTLTRELSKRNTRFFEILDTIRCEWARWYLRDSSLDLKSIAALLGYASVSSFTDAFKRWTEQTPGQFRQENTLIN